MLELLLTQINKPTGAIIITMPIQRAESVHYIPIMVLKPYRSLSIRLEYILPRFGFFPRHVQILQCHDVFNGSRCYAS